MLPSSTAHQATISQLLREAQRLGIDRLDGQVLLGDLLERPRAWLLAHDDDAVGAAVAAQFRRRCETRLEGQPVAYLLGWREFRGLRFEVGPAVLVPRPETEELVDWALQLLDAEPAAAASEVVDLGTGSGAIAISLALARPALQVHATDISPDALALAARNARRLGAEVRWHTGTWWHALAGSSGWRLAVSNPPYIAGNDPHLESLKSEPLAALTPGPSGLEALRELISGAPSRLAPGGWMLVEHGHDQGAAVRALFEAVGLEGVGTRRDMAGRERCTGGRRRMRDSTI